MNNFGRTFNFGTPGHQYSYGIFSQPGGFGPAFPSTYSTGYSPSYGPLFAQPQMFSGYNGGLGGGYSQGQLDAYYGYQSAPSHYSNPYAYGNTQRSYSTSYDNDGPTVFSGWE